MEYLFNIEAKLHINYINTRINSTRVEVKLQTKGFVRPSVAGDTTRKITIGNCHLQQRAKVNVKGSTTATESLPELLAVIQEKGAIRVTNWLRKMSYGYKLFRLKK